MLPRDQCSHMESSQIPYILLPLTRCVAFNPHLAAMSMVPVQAKIGLPPLAPEMKAPLAPLAAAFDPGLAPIRAERPKGTCGVRYVNSKTVSTLWQHFRLPDEDPGVQNTCYSASWRVLEVSLPTGDHHRSCLASYCVRLLSGSSTHEVFA